MEKLDKLKRLIAENAGCNVEDIELKSKLIEDLNVDSLDIVELTMAIEDEFGVAIPDEELENISTVEDILNFL